MAERRKFSPEYKVRVVLEMLKGEKGLMQASRDYGIKDTVLSRWKQEFLERSPDVFRQEGTEEQREMAGRIAELERMVGRLTLELDTAKKVLGISNSTKRNGGGWGKNSTKKKKYRWNWDARGEGGPAERITRNTN